MSQDRSLPLDIDQLVTLARQLVDRDLLDEATELFQLAQRLEPENLGIKLSLAQLRNRQRQRSDEDQADVGKIVLERVRRDTIDAFHFFGLAALYEERGKKAQAMQCLEIAGDKAAINPFVHKLRGKILSRQGRYDEAAEALRRARRENPFDRETAEILSRVEYERSHYEKALDSAIDAFWLLEPRDATGSDRLTRRIRTYRALLKLPRESLVERFRQRREQLETSFDRLEYHRERLVEGNAPDAADRIAAPPTSVSSDTGRIDLASQLRALTMLEPFEDTEIFHLAAIASSLTVAEGAKLFDEGGTSRDIYILERGELHILRDTSYQRVVLGSVAPGSVLGEVNFIASGGRRLADVVAAESSQVLRLDGAGLAQLIADRPTIGVKVYQAFWHALASKLRRANDQLSTFFADDPPLVRGDDASDGVHDTLHVESGDKLKVLQEQGLTANELATLANFSEVKRFPSGTYLFREGDSGDEMYVVLDGRVRISKFIAGGGEEALAILDRGDVFGEMALVDGQPRSADACAHSGPVTVIAFDGRLLEEVLSMDAQAALQFMQLLCRLLCRRLREIDEKLTTWRILEGVGEQDGVEHAGDRRAVSDRH